MAALLGCTPRPYLYWNPEVDPNTIPPGPRFVSLTDRRPGIRGGGHADVIGRERGAVGEPNWMSLSAPSSVTGYRSVSLTDTLQRLIVQAIAESGAADLQTARFAIDLQDFWCDGYLVTYSADISFDVLVFAGDSETVQARVPVRTSARANKCRKAYAKGLTLAHDSLMNTFRQPLPLPPPPAMPAGQGP